MSDTPRTDAEERSHGRSSLTYVSADFARQLERELTAIKDDAFASGTAARCWYEAASPYATPEALKEALAGRSGGDERMSHAD